MKLKLRAFFVLICCFLTALLFAEEGGSGHYMPGAMASFIDVLPGREAFVYANSFLYYNGSAGGARPLRFGGQLAANIEAAGCAGYFCKTDSGTDILAAIRTAVGQGDLS